MISNVGKKVFGLSSASKNSGIKSSSSKTASSKQLAFPNIEQSSSTSKPDKNIENTPNYMPSEKVLSTEPSLDNGLTHEEKSVAIKRLTKMDRCRTSGQEVLLNLSTRKVLKNKEVLDSTSNLCISFGWVCQAGYYPENLNKANQDNLLIITNEAPLRILPKNKTDGNVLYEEKDFALFSVFDGHGQYGTECSTFAADNFKSIFFSAISAISGGNQSSQGEGVNVLSRDQLKKCLSITLEELNIRMHKQKYRFSDMISGTTAICILVLEDEVYTANVGDSRAVMGFPEFTHVADQAHYAAARVIPLSIDQTPFRKDERDRCKRAGAIIMSMDQMEGLAPYSPNQDNWGNEEDAAVDPPRVWSTQQGSPGVAFTRSLGDEFVEQIGCIATPEISVMPITNTPSTICAASDGVFEFLNSEMVIEMFAHFQAKYYSFYKDSDQPSGVYEAAKAVVSEAYKLWLHYEIRTDDITAIVLFVKREGDQGEMDPIKGGTDASTPVIPLLRSSDEQKPVRRVISKEKRQLLKPATDGLESDLEEEMNTGDQEKFKKTLNERIAITDSIKTNFLFQHLTESQLEKVLDAFERVSVNAGDVVIQQGEKGDKFYVVLTGEFDCYVKPTDEADTQPEDNKFGTVVHSYEASNDGFGNPSFGELALMFSEPRAATIIAKTPGTLWALHRRVFRRLFVKGSSNQTIVKLLRDVPIFASLTKSQLQRLADVVSEQKYEDGDAVIRQGELGDVLYIMKLGTVKCVVDTTMRPYSQQSVATEATGTSSGSKRRFSRHMQPDQVDESPVKEVMRINPGGYFGERALLYHEPRAASVLAVGKIQVLCLSRMSFEKLLGPLQTLIQRHSQLREEEALSREILKVNRKKLFGELIDGKFGFDQFESISKVEVGHETDQDSETTFYQGMLKKDRRTVTIKSTKIAQIEENKLQERAAADRLLLLLCVTKIDPHDSETSPLPTVAFENNYSFVARLMGAIVGETMLHLVLHVNVVGSLFDLVSSSESGVLDEGSVCFIAACVINGLNFLHSKSIACRSVNMNSLQLDESGVVVLCDLSLGKYLEDDGARALSLCGDPAYFSPEQILSKGADLSVDWWSLGLLLYELLYAKLPYLQTQSETFNDSGNQDVQPGEFNEESLADADRLLLITNFDPSKLYFTKLPSSGQPLPVEAQKIIQLMLQTDTNRRRELDFVLTNHAWLSKHCLSADKIEGYARSPLFAWCEQRIETIASKQISGSIEKEKEISADEMKHVWYSEFFQM